MAGHRDPAGGVAGARAVPAAGPGRRGAAGVGAPIPDPAPGERLLTDERDRALWRHFQRLPERCRTLLRIVAQVARPDYSAVAEAMGMPIGSIGPTRGRCLAKLHAMLLADPDGADDDRSC